jgi:hypothetical protein
VFCLVCQSCNFTLHWCCFQGRNFIFYWCCCFIFNWCCVVYQGCNFIISLVFFCLSRL